MIMITGIVLMFVAGLLSFIPFIVLIAQIALLILWLMGLVSAIQGNKSEVPIIGSYGQKWFKSL